MKKSEFEKLKVGDLVQLRTLDEIKQLKCYDKMRNCIYDDSKHVRSYLVRSSRKLGERAIVAETNVKYDKCAILVDFGGFQLHVVRQHLKGAK